MPNIKLRLLLLELIRYEPSLSIDRSEVTNMNGTYMERRNATAENARITSQLIRGGAVLHAYGATQAEILIPCHVPVINVVLFISADNALYGHPR